MVDEVRHIQQHEQREPVRQVVHEHEERIVDVPGAERRIIVVRVYQLIWLVFGLLEALMGLRVFLKLIAANPNNPFAQLVYMLSEIFLLPFEGLTATPSVEGIVLEIHSIIAMLVYALAAWAISQLIWTIFYKPSTRKVIKSHRDWM